MNSGVRDGYRYFFSLGLLGCAAGVASWGRIVYARKLSESATAPRLFLLG